MAFVGGYTVFLPGNWNVPDFLFSYMMIGVFPVLFFTWKVLKRTKWMEPHEADLYKDVEEIEEHQRNYVEEPPKYVSQMSANETANFDAGIFSSRFWTRRLARKRRLHTRDRWQKHFQKGRGTCPSSFSSKHRTGRWIATSQGSLNCPCEPTTAESFSRQITDRIHFPKPPASAA